MRARGKGGSGHLFLQTTRSARVYMTAPIGSWFDTKVTQARTIELSSQKDCL